VMLTVRMVAETVDEVLWVDTVEAESLDWRWTQAGVLHRRTPADCRQEFPACPCLSVFSLYALFVIQTTHTLTS